MIKISIDEAAAFDMLAILAIKADKTKDINAYSKFVDELYSCLGVIKVNDILCSTEYEDLVVANQNVFNLIDGIDAGYNQDALTVHTANMERFYAKKKLQKKFFNNTLTEMKTVK